MVVYKSNTFIVFIVIDLFLITNNQQIDIIVRIWLLTILFIRCN